MAENAGAPHPPTAPEIHREFRLTWWQWVGVPLFLLIPVLAVFGLLGEATTRVESRTANLAFELEYPRTHRYKLVRDIRLAVTNTTARVLDTVTVDLDPGYAAAFGNATAIPDFDRAYGFDLTGLAPGETRRVRIELEGLDYGRQEGELLITPGGADTAWIPLRTFVFP